MSIAIFAFSAVFCLNKKNNSNKKLEKAKSEYLLESLLKNGNDEFIELLSIKYNLKIDLTHKIIDEFTQDDSILNLLSSISDAKTVEEFEEVKTKIKKPSVEKRIKIISIENNIEQSLIASLLIDYKIWYESQHDETY